MSIYNPSEYPQGVPNPNVPNVSLYPTYEHGPDYTRPVFSSPYIRTPFNNVSSGVGQLNVLAEYDAKKKRALLNGAGAAMALGSLLSLMMTKPGNRLWPTLQGAVAFGVVGLVAAGVTYSTWPKVLE